MNLRKLLIYSAMIALLSFAGALMTGLPRGLKVTPTEIIYLLVLLLSYFTFYATPLLLLRAFIQDSNKFRKWVFSLTVLWVLYFGFDSLQFKIFRSHLTYFVAMNTFEGFQAGEVGDMKISKALVFQILAIMLLFYSLTVIAFKKIEARESKPLLRKLSERQSAGLVACVMLALLIPLTRQREWLKNFGWSQLLENHVSIYDELTFEGLYSHISGERHFSFLTEKALSKVIIKNAEQIPAVVHAEQRPNILFIHMESLRWDSLTPERMPFLWSRLEKCRQAKTCFSSDSHYSSGNNTPTGIFGMLSGLNSFYYYPFRVREMQPPALGLFKKMGYRRSIWLSTSLNYDNLHQFMFNDFEVFDRASDEGHNARHFDYQTEITEKMLADMRSSKTEPRLDYLQSYLTHFNYYFSDACAIHEPYVKLPFNVDSQNFHHMESQFPLLKNRFLNGVCESDRMVEHIFTELEKMKRLKNTIVVVFGDHGEEFGEHGRFGHSYGLNDEQVRTVFAMFFPKPIPEPRYAISSHSDVMPTILDYMRVRAPISTITNGKSLLQYDPTRDFAIIGMGTTGKTFPNRYAAVSANYKAFFENQSEIDAEDAEVFDRHDSMQVKYDFNQVQKLLESAESSKQISH